MLLKKLGIMEEYAFVAVCNGGIYCSQYHAANLQDALIEWCCSLPKKNSEVFLKKWHQTSNRTGACLAAN